MERDMQTVADITRVYSKNKTKIMIRKGRVINNIKLVLVVIDFLLSVGQC